MIATDAALYAASSSAALLPGGRVAITTCSCGQELLAIDRRHCPRCGCCLP